MSNGKADLLRLPSQVMLPDERLEVFVLHNRETGETRLRTIEDFYNDIARYTLGPNVPNDVFDSFETARNLYLYSYFVYRFTVVSSLQAFTALEFALREKAILEGVPKCIGEKGKEVPITLYEGLYMAIKRGWISDEMFAKEGIKVSSRNLYCKGLMSRIPQLRNKLGHGSFILYPQPQAQQILKVVSQLINLMFTSEEPV
jgi:hypothetical protein